MKPCLHTVGLVVREMPRALAFYRALGLEIPEGEDRSPHVEFEGPNGYAIGFITEAMTRQADPRWVDVPAGRINLQFCFESPAEVNAAHERLVRSGYESYQAPWDAFWGQRFARVVDPDSNVVNLFASLEG